MRTRTARILLLLLSAGPLARAAEEVPFWYLDSWYSMDHTMSVGFSGDQGTLGLAGGAVGTRWTYLGQEERELHSTGARYLCRIVGSEGEMSGAGLLDLEFPRQLAFPVEIREAGITGETCITDQDLSLAIRTTRIRGRLWGQPWGDWWVPLGELDLELTEEFDPPLDLFGFPIELGRQWSQTPSHAIFGRCNLNLSVFGRQHDVGGRVGETMARDLAWSTDAIETIQDWEAYRSTGQDAGSTGAIRAWYAPQAEWWVQLTRSQELIGETGAVLAAESLRVMDFQVGPPPTPTPAGIGVDLILPADRFSPGDPCALDAFCYNDGPDRDDVPLFVLLDVYGDLFFWPSWEPYPPMVDWQEIHVPSGGASLSIIPVFTWPDTGSDALGGLFFYGAMLNEAMTEVWGNLDAEEFSYGPRP